MDGAIGVGFIEFEGAVDEGFHLGDLGDDVGVIFGDADGGAPGEGGPIEEGDVFFAGAFYGCAGVVGEVLGEVAMGGIESAEAVVEGTEVEAAGAVAEGFGGGEIGIFEFIGLELDEGVGVLGEAAGGGEEEFFVFRAFGEEAFHEFEAEGDGGFDEFGVVIGGEGGTAGGEGITDHIDGHAFGGAAGGE
ncbi:MAG: hypothetical protein RI897_1387 [Verrucomicrobiota bacterium]